MLKTFESFERYRRFSYFMDLYRGYIEKRIEKKIIKILNLIVATITGKIIKPTDHYLIGKHGNDNPDEGGKSKTVTGTIINYVY
jgi:hypothetical protein